jgi:hypothetical protein
MAYAEVEDIKSRAGRLRDAWDDTTTVSDGDLERFIRDAGATVDMALAAHGYDAPATDPLVTAALTPVVADMALLMALTATWPGGSGPAAVSDLIGEVRARVEGKDGKGGYLAALADGQIGFLMYLREQEQGDSSGASDFWNRETSYSSYLDDLQTGRIVLMGSGVVLRSPIGPGVHKDMTF